MTEAAIQKSAINALRARGCVCIKQSTMQKYGTSGWPDYLVLAKGGRSFWIEFKQPGKKLTGLQAEKKAQLEALGQRVVVCHSKGEALVAYEEEIGR